MAEEEKTLEELQEDLDKAEEMLDGLDAFADAVENGEGGDAGQMFDFLLGMMEMMGDDAPAPIVFEAGHVDFEFFEADIEEPWCVLQMGDEDEKTTLFGKGTKISEVRANKVVLMLGCQKAGEGFPETREEFDEQLGAEFTPENGYEKVNFGGVECYKNTQEGADVYINADFDLKAITTIGILNGGDEALKVAETVKFKI